MTNPTPAQDTLATQRQIAAARPDASTWLGANAGSGKTRVLTNRVARLLLAGVPPQHILCLTYTKAAAGEMQNRLFATLGAWAMRPDGDLRADLAALGEEIGPDPDRLARVRRLFARAIETPGGLKIQTIHAFCAALLRRFPLEAGVSPQFTEMDDRSAGLMIETVLERMSDGPEAGLVTALAEQLDETGLIPLCQQILKARDAFPPSPDAGALWASLDLAPGDDLTALLNDTFAPGDAALLCDLLPHLSAGSKTDQSAGDKLRPFGPFAPALRLLETLEGLMLFGAKAKDPHGPKIGKFPTKATATALGPDAIEALNGLMARVADARARRLALASAQRSLTLLRFASAFLPRMAAAKEARGWLDFDDLILRTRALLTNPGLAAWVLYKLDGGIDHILVDEAQDTSPAQWDVIRLLAQEFTSGDSADDGRGRTLFVVGDKKQSIYSFQGADPSSFDRLRAHFRDGLEAVGDALHDRELAHSFRSAPAILGAVDATFAEGSGLGAPPAHVAFKADLPGRVDLWPALLGEKAEKGRPDNAGGWDPIDRRDPDSPTVQLARATAQEVRRMTRDEALIDQKGAPRPLTPGDVLILFRRRGSLFFETLEALKAAGLPVAGADRIKLTEELAVRDLLALLRFLALPEDDLSLAAALRSPLFGWDEDRLFRLAHPRPPQSYLWAALRSTDSEPETRAMLQDLRDQADFLRPFDLLERILIRHRGRARLLGRLGVECEEAIDGLLQQALDYEQVEPPSLTGFLEWMAAEDVELKRQAEAAGGRVRVMTVHGSKGLEAPVVFLPDCGPFKTKGLDKVLPRAGDSPVWGPASAETPPVLEPTVAAVRAAEAEERDRLLYVAMTRAEQWLVISAAGDPGKGTSWHGQAAAGLERAGAAALDTPLGQGKRLASGIWPARPAPAAPSDDGQETAPRPLPPWLDQPAPAPLRPAPTLAPSSLGGAKALPGEGADTETALRVGRQIHLLLEHLPAQAPPAWPALASALLAQGADAAPAEEIADRLEEVTALLTAPELRDIFAAQSLAEVPLSAPLPDLGQTVAGTIDRLIVTPSHVQAVDFKTNRVVPGAPEAVPAGILAQMGAYAAALAQIYPDREIETALLWTRSAQLMRLPPALVSAALAQALAPS